MTLAPVDYQPGGTGYAAPMQGGNATAQASAPVATPAVGPFSAPPPQYAPVYQPPAPLATAQASLPSQSPLYSSYNSDLGTTGVDIAHAAQYGVNGLTPYSQPYQPPPLSPSLPNAVNSSVGLVQAGNIDLNNRPRVTNPDGSISTVRSISIDQDGRTVLIPTVIGNRVVSNDEAIQHYLNTGEQLGIFDNGQNADSYAENLHNSQAAMLPKKQSGLAGILDTVKGYSAPMQGGSATAQPSTQAPSIPFASTHGYARNSAPW